MKAHELLSDESRWCKGFIALDKDTKMCSFEDSGAVKFCIIGAIYKCYNDNFNGLADSFNKLRCEIRKSTLSDWNDAPERTFAEVKELLAKLDI